MVPGFDFFGALSAFMAGWPTATTTLRPASSPPQWAERQWATSFGLGARLPFGSVPSYSFGSQHQTTLVTRTLGRAMSGSSAAWSHLSSVWPEGPTKGFERHASTSPGP